MAQIVITVPDNMVQKLLAAFAMAYNYQETILGPDLGSRIPNPESKAAFARRHIQEYIKGVYVSAKARADIETLTKTAIDAATIEIEGVGVE